MSEVVLRILGVAEGGIAAVREFRTQIHDTQVATADLREQWKATTAEIIESQRAQIQGEKAKLDEYKAQIAAAREVTASYTRGSEERRLATKLEIDLQRRYQAVLGETAAIAAKGGRAGASGSAERDASGFARGAASRSGVASAGLAGLAGPGFIAGAVVGGAIDIGVKAARDEQVAQANLANALRDTGNARRGLTKRTEEYAVQEEHSTGFTRDQVIQSLSMLIRATGSLTTARKDEAVMANIARARQTDLSGAYMLVVKASEGNVGALHRLGIEVSKTTTYEDELKKAHLTGNFALEQRAKALDLAATKSDVMRVVTQKFAGDSTAYMKTFAGSTADLRNEFHDLEVQIGEKSIPVLRELFTWVGKEITAARESHTVHKILHDTFEVLRTAWLGAKAIAEAFFDLMHNRAARDIAIATGAVWLLNAAVEANPFVAAAAASLLAVGEIVKHWKSIKSFFTNLWRDIEAIFFYAWDEMKIGAVDAVLKIIEPFSHLPGSMGKWARNMKDELHGQLVLMHQDAQHQAALIGGGAGKAMYQAYLPWMQQISGATAGAFSTGQPFSGSARGGSGAGAGSAGGSAGGGNFQQGNIVRTARTQLGIPYQFGGAQILGHPTDCAGLAHAVLAQNGIHIGTTSEQQWTQGTPVKWGDLQPGDLVFFDTHDKQTPPSHVGIYIGNGQFIEDPHTGASVRVSNLNDSYWHANYMGARRYVQTVSHAASGSGDPSGNAKARGTGGSPTAADKAFAAAVAAAPSSSASKGLKTASLTGILGSIDAELRAVPSELDPVERAAIAHIKQLRADLHVGMSADELAKDRVELAKWGKQLRDEITKNANDAKKVAAQHKKELAAAARDAAKAWASAWSDDAAIIDRAVGEKWARVQRDFDRETSAHLTQMQRAFAATQREFDRETQQGLQGFVVGQTPEEAALAQFQSARDAAQSAQDDAKRQTDLAAAISGGDPQQIAQAQDAINQAALDAQEKGLQAAADASRTAADAQTARQQQSYQDQRDTLAQALSDQETLAEQSYQDRRDAQWQALNDLHDDQVKQFDNDLATWSSWLQTKKKSWADFLKFLQDNPVSKGFDGSAIGNPATAPGAGLVASGAIGGAPDALSRYLAGAGSSTTVFQTNVYNPTVLGGTEQQVGAALEQLVTPQQTRATRYLAPI